MQYHDIFVAPIGYELSRTYYLNRKHDVLFLTMSYAQTEEDEDEIRAMTNDERVNFLLSKGFTTRTIQLNF